MVTICFALRLHFMGKPSRAVQVAVVKGPAYLPQHGVRADPRRLKGLQRLECRLRIDQVARLQSNKHRAPALVALLAPIPVLGCLILRTTTKRPYRESNLVSHDFPLSSANAS